MDKLLKYCKAYEKGEISLKTFEKFIHSNEKWIFCRDSFSKDTARFLSLFYERFPFLKYYVSKNIPQHLEAIKDALTELKNSDELRFLYQYPCEIQIKPTIYDNYDLKAIHQSSFNNKKLLKKHNVCGRFRCKKIFKTDEIYYWIDDNKTAMCPYCFTDSVIGPACGYPVTEGLLYIMSEIYFLGC